MKRILLATFILLSGCATNKPQSSPTDKYLWLEDSKNPQVRPWVDAHNAKVIQQLENDPRAKAVSADIRKIITADDRIPMPSIAGDKIRNFWQDKKHVRGIWRQTSRAEYAKAKPKWETILDIDALNKKENKSWVFHGATCLAPDMDLCLIELSDGGRDESVVREFQVAKKEFVKDGFELPPAKSRVTWYDKNTLLVGTDFGPNTLTTSGYPRQMKAWTRGTPLASAELIFEGKPDDVSVYAEVSIRPDGRHAIIAEDPTFFSSRQYLWEPGQPLKRIPFPETASFEGIFNETLVTRLREDWTAGARQFPRGSLVALPVAAIGQPDEHQKLEAIYSPDSTSALMEVEFTKDYVELIVMHNVLGEILRMSRASDGQWTPYKLPLPTDGTVSFVSADEFDVQNRFFVTYQSFLTPPTLFQVNNKTPVEVKHLPAKFNAKDLVTEQFMATNKDGTKIPYFIVHKKGMKLDGTTPTLQYGYGGFENSQTPFYLGTIGKLWVEKGGAYVLANIRGGGEFGPRWHEAALKQNRQKAYDDFWAVSQDLFARKITSPRRLGIEGGSNGGLLVGATVTQHPGDYHAVVCESALLDMIRYTKLPPGASWIGEYGDPDDPKVAEYINKFSPYQNVRPNTKYPKIFFHISTADDRVQPGHTRKMVARLEENGADVLMFENTEGGHGGAADLEQRVKKSTLIDIYLYQQLMD